ncbi:pyridine nucleotide-disulfide oxidoreductase [Saccharospirillum sp. MSK14-1]|uniref:NAD(P)/FAD-dependent oxidoreductase n=1 Tax=Saccharospirillum sp. MSK14-1 TaxID=1897632 RepID=UPI000D3DB500|nr:FAD/NAD(P)-binding oxidoreductase [Saccharospirillum sp. MSK14-1]PTY35972.1 pyridine nucleotide-disulfide oxidoreductase [Saccharospirillum sp. MSK14-1]
MTHHYQIVIAGGGAAGIAVAASLKQRQASLRIAVVEPNQTHVYQPGQTLVGRGVMRLKQLQRSTVSLLPKGVDWVQQRVAAFEPDQRQIRLDNDAVLHYEQLVVALGLELNLQAIEGLADTLGKNGVTSNYVTDIADYTWQQVQSLRSGKAIFTQPPMPIKCAGAPQKAMYLSCDYWQQQGRLGGIEVQFHNAGAALFGVAEFVPVLESYVRSYGAMPVFGSTLVRVDGPNRKAWFSQADGGEREVSFDLLHVTPPQRAPAVVRDSALANEAGWLDVDQYSLQHPRYANVFSLGDVCSAPNAKTAAAVRKQAPVVARNILAMRKGQSFPAVYNGYGACPLTVEAGKVVLAEFGYGGQLQPSFPLNPTRPRRFYWWMKTTLFPWVYWHLMLKGREWWLKYQRPDQT